MTFFSLIGESYNTTDRVMRSGDLLFVDYGAAKYKTYAADICRTFPVSGRFTPEQRKYYDIVLEAQLAAIAAIKPGVLMVDVIRKSAEVFRKHGLEQFEDPAKMGADRVWGIMPSPTHYLARNAGIVPYTPRGVGVRDLGHHIGLETHDSRNYSVPLEPGMVVTIEPKIYIPDQNIAIMIEDMILVTADGNENLSSATPKTAAEVEAAMEVGDPTRPMNGTVVAFQSGALTLHGVMWKPEGPGPFPAVVFNHGSEFAPRDLPELGPLFTRHGYVLFGPTRRGHGRSTDQAPYIGQVLAQERQQDGTAAWSRLLVRLLKTDHLDDQLAGLEYLKAQPYVDASRIAVMGGSFGGIQTMLAAEKARGIRSGQFCRRRAELGGCARPSRAHARRRPQRHRPRLPDPGRKRLRHRAESRPCRRDGTLEKTASREDLSPVGPDDARRSCLRRARQQRVGARCLRVPGRAPHPSLRRSIP